MTRDIKNSKRQYATFGAGCFWGVEEVFRGFRGVVKTEAGYSGGTLENPTYEDVCTDKTGHVEVVRVQYDTSQVQYQDLLKVFWKCHDPTTPNRQGPDVGSQYMSVIFFHDKEQEMLALQTRDILQNSGKFRGKIVTEILPAPAFYLAEEYHQQYLHRRGMGSCHL